MTEKHPETPDQIPQLEPPVVRRRPAADVEVTDEPSTAPVESVVAVAAVALPELVAAAVVSPEAVQGHRRQTIDVSAPAKQEPKAPEPEPGPPSPTTSTTSSAR